MGNASMEWVDNTFRNRWRTLLSVDDMIGDLIESLHKNDELNNTYIVYASDNGFHLGEQYNAANVISVHCLNCVTQMQTVLKIKVIYDNSGLIEYILLSQYGGRSLQK